mmetsp:Transcript_69483/g.157064  ORF Transcript_69483/g.157064 Transcript_69483/m.157064 type:complete len:240 (-) Transcript_69483:164-883(-)
MPRRFSRGVLQSRRRRSRTEGGTTRRGPSPPRTRHVSPSRPCARRMRPASSLRNSPACTCGTRTPCARCCPSGSAGRPRLGTWDHPPWHASGALCLRRPSWQTPSSGTWSGWRRSPGAPERCTSGCARTFATRPSATPSRAGKFGSNSASSRRCTGSSRLVKSWQSSLGRHSPLPGTTTSVAASLRPYASRPSWPATSSTPARRPSRSTGPYSRVSGERPHWTGTRSRGRFTAFSPRCI